MLKELCLQNFRAFDDEVRVCFRPITVLIGRNNSGKSTLLKFLLMLRQTLESQSDQFLVTEGRHVHLGAFEDLKHSRSRKAMLRFAMTFETLSSPTQFFLDFGDAREAKTRKRARRPFMEHEFALTGKQLPGWEEGRSAVFKVSAVIPYGGSQKRGHHSVIARLGKRVLYDRSATLDQCRLLRPFRPAADQEAFIRAFSENSVIAPIRQELLGLRHLAAVREEFRRIIIVSAPPEKDVGRRGEHTLVHLERILRKGGKRGRFVKEHVREVAHMRGVTFGRAMRGYIAHCSARNTETKAASYLADFGFGASQCLPVIVQGALMRKNQTLLVEQPEAHLHPTAQLEMGSVFASLWNLRQVRCVIETHSPNVLLRLRRLVAQGTLKPDDVSVAYFHTRDKKVSVKNLGIDKDGRIQKGLPMEFFGADILESLEFGRKK